VQAVGERLRRLLGGIKQVRKRIAAYGAAAKGVIMVNYVGAGPETIDFVADRNIHKQGKFLPGVRIPIVAPDALMERRPDYVMLLTWNFQEEILRQQEPYRRAGGKFIIPIPSPVVL
jgi:hypothetical protein